MKLAYNNEEPNTDAKITSLANPINFLMILELNIAKKSSVDLLANIALKFIMNYLLHRFDNN